MLKRVVILSSNQEKTIRLDSRIIIIRILNENNNYFNDLNNNKKIHSIEINSEFNKLSYLRMSLNDLRSILEIFNNIHFFKMYTF